jgi:ribosomal protein S12 methylthiotransferase accessory factor
MAAGNTLEEALVQGISEVYEHIIWNKVYEDIEKPIPELNFKKLNLPKSLKNKGNRLYSLGYNFKIFDYSYLYNIPVIGILLINKKEYNYSLILGSSPIFEIALERCFTEIY